MDAARRASLRAAVVEIRQRRSSLVRRISELCFLPASDAHVSVLQKTVRALDRMEDELHMRSRFVGGV